MNTLQKSSENVIKNCLQINKNDRIVIISDNDSWEIGTSLQDEALKITPTTLLLKIEDYSQRPLTEFPAKLKKDLISFKPNVSIYAAQGKKGELPVFRTPLRELLVHKLKCAHAHMISISKEIMLDGMAADYNVLYEVTNKIYNIVRNAKEIRATSSKGTDITAKLSKKMKWLKDDGKITKPGYWRNLPGTEVFTCPEDVNGIVVADIMGDYFSEKYGLLKNPITIKVKKGYAYEVECKDENIEKEFKEYIFTSPLGNRVGEFAIGTNIGLKKLIGNLLQDEKFPGIHMAFGSSYSDETGADWDCPTHVDVIPTEVDIYVDGKQIMKKGKFII